MEEHVATLAKRSAEANTGTEAQQFGEAARAVADSIACLACMKDEQEARRRRWVAEDAFDKREAEKAIEASAETATADPDAAKTEQTKPAAKPAKT